MKKYINPEMKINMFECEAVATQASTVEPDDGYVAGLEEVTERTQINLSQMKEITKFVF